MGNRAAQAAEPPAIIPKVKAPIKAPRRVKPKAKPKADANADGDSADPEAAPADAPTARRGSGSTALDQAAIDTVEKLAPFAPFPEALARETQQLDIVRTWQFRR